ncbi:hypothetical protein HKL94_00750 [Candidatus Parcubacteria bacterium]|nr:hypothetical protein [Candidatus Parcubacteria bacterium]
MSDPIPSDDMEMFRRIAKVVQEIPDKLFDPENKHVNCINHYSCHLICRGVEAHFKGVRTEDGYFHRHHQHSWLVSKSGRSIIDVYPVAGATPFIVSTERASPWSELYKINTRYSGMFHTDTFRANVETTIRLVGQTIERLAHSRPS